MSINGFEIVIDLYGDWIKILRGELISEGYEIDAGEDSSQICIKYFNVQKRHVRSRRRSVEVSREFTNPAEYQAAIELIKSKAINGENLTPHLSTSLLRPDFNDALLNDWGIHHFHLGVSAHRRNSLFVERTGPLLFSRVTEEKFYMIDVMQHGDWSQTRLIEILHSNWPESIKHYKLQMGNYSQALSADEIKNFRDHGVSVMPSLSDDTVYAPMGGGYSSTGVSIEVVKNCDFYRKLLEDSEKHVRENIRHHIEQARLYGINIGSQCQFQLVELSRNSVDIIETNSHFRFTIPFEHVS